MTPPSSHPVGERGVMLSEPGARSRRVGRVPAVTVLLATRSSSTPNWALLRASAMAQSLHATLNVLRVVSRPGRVPYQRVTNPTASELHRALEIEHQLHDWVRLVLPQPIDPAALLVEEGHFVEEVAMAAADLSAALVILPTAEGRHALAVTAVMRRTGVPVLVLRPGAGNLVVAATDMAREGFPVVKTAALLVDRLASSLLVVHNVQAASSDSDAAVASVHRLAHRRSQRLEESLRTLAPAARRVVLDEPSPDQAIVKAADENSAALLVIGAPLDRGHSSRGTAERVLSTTERSVLVTPVH